MTTMQYILDKLSVGDTVFYACYVLVENSVNDLSSSYAHEISSGVIDEISPEYHGVYLSESNWENNYSSPVNRFHDADAIIANEYEMREMLWRAYASVCRRARDLQESATQKNNHFFRKNFGELVDVPDCEQFAAMFGYDGIGNPVTGFGIVGYDDGNGFVEFIAKPASLYEQYGGTITSYELFSAEDGEALVDACLNMVSNYLY